MSEWSPFREPLQRTLTRTVGIALLAGGVFSYWRRDLTLWPAATTLALWPSFGGHWIELWFLNWLRPRLPDRPTVQAATRLGAWFVGGIALAAGMWITATALATAPPARLAAWSAWWWIAGLGFVGIELVAHLGLQLRGRPSFFNGRG